jgi:hypothetical protein
MQVTEQSNQGAFKRNPKATHYGWFGEKFIYLAPNNPDVGQAYFIVNKPLRSYMYFIKTEWERMVVEAQFLGPVYIGGPHKMRLWLSYLWWMADISLTDEITRPQTAVTELQWSEWMRNVDNMVIPKQGQT